MSAGKARVVITGLGALTPIGSDVGTYWQNLLAGRSGVAPITLFPTEGMPVTIGAEIKGFQPTDHIDPKDAQRQDRFCQFAVATGKMALDDSGLNLDTVNRDRFGCIIGSGIGGLWEIQEQHTRYLQRGRTSPFFVPKMMLNAAPGWVALTYGLRGPNFGIASACASANHAMGVSFRTIQYGDADLMLAGGAEGALAYLALSGFTNMKALSRRNEAPEKASRPFDKDRDGFVMGEGSGLLVFERLEHALDRGARIYAEVLGFGNSDDAFHPTAPDGTGRGGAYAINAALEDAGLKPEQISYINAHGTSTPLNDKTETLAIKSVFGDHAKKVPISSSKSMIGHLLGAAAAVELIAVALSIRDGVVHPTINYETPDPECDLDYVPNEKRRVDVQYAISNSLGFGGHNSTLAIGRYEK